MFERQESKNPLSWRQRAIVLTADVLMLVEVAIAMYLASMSPDEFTVVFMKSFFAMFLPTLTAALVAVRLARPKPLAQAE